MTDGDPDFAGMINGGKALGEVLGDLEARAGRFGRVLTGALASAVEGGRGLDEILKTAGTRLVEIALSAGLKPLQDSVSTGLGSVMGQMAGRAVPALSGGGLAAPVFLGGAALTGGDGGKSAMSAAVPFPSGGSSGAGGAPNVVFNVTARDAESFRKSEGQIAAMLTRAVGRGRRGV